MRRLQQDARQLLLKALGADFFDLLGMPADGIGRGGVQLEIQRGGKPHGAHHTQVIFRKPVIRVAHGPDQARGQVRLAANIVAHRAGQGIQEQCVHCEVAAEGIRLLVGEHHAFGMAPIAVSLIFAEGGHLVFEAVDPNPHHAKRLAHGHRSGE